MRILKLYDGDYPWDVREEKILRALAGRGHEVTLLARNRQGRARRERLADEGIWIRRLPRGGRLERIVGLPLPVNPAWLLEGLGALRAARPERVLVRDLALAPLGLFLARRAGCPAIVDMSEPYPEALRANWQYGQFGGFDHVLRSPRLADIAERWVVRRAPRTLVVSEEAGERLEQIGLPPERCTLVRNTIDLGRLQHREPRQPDLPRELQGRRLVVFSGILVGDRGIDVAIEGIGRLARGGDRTLALVVIGEGPARARFEAQARALGLGEQVRFLGWVPYPRLPDYWRASQVGILPFHACTHMDVTLANKIFEYMGVGLPIVASDTRSMSRLLRETGAGITFRAGDPGDFARAVDRILSDPSYARMLGERGRKAAVETYRWERDAERLIEAVEHP